MTEHNNTPDQDVNGTTPKPNTKIFSKELEQQFVVLMTLANALLFISITALTAKLTWQGIAAVISLI